MKYFLHLSYKGTHYRGWQRQENVISIQEALEQNLSKMLGYSLPCIGCGRTDAGVHASQYFCHITLKDPLTYDPVFRINKMLPNDIVVHEFLEMPKEAHTQYDALERTYTYRIHGKPNPFIDDLSTYVPLDAIDIEKLRLAASYLKGTHDFRAFCKQPDVYKTTDCRISKVTITYLPQQFIFTITANRFLRGMVRLIVGNLLEIGNGKLTIEQFRSALDHQQPLPYFRMAYPQGLYLSKVSYPYLDIPTKEVNC